MTTLFLDYDGTLHGWPIREPFEHASALADVLAPTDVEIVLTTSWVWKYGWVVASAHLPEALRVRVVGSVYEGIADGALSHLTRASVIERYLARPRWPLLSKWVVLDDAASTFEREERVIRCNPKTGLTRVELERLAGLLRGFER